MPDSHTSITELTVPSGNKRELMLHVDGFDLTIPVDEALFASYRNHFARKCTTERHRKAFATLLRLMRAAYLKGYDDGKKRA